MKMLYEIAHLIQNKLPWVWNGVEALNAWGVEVRTGGRRSSLPKQFERGIRLATKEDAGALAQFFAKQPEESFRWFRPHGFDEATLRRLLARSSFIAFVMEDGQKEICGYAFLRCFVNGKCFLGKMVDVDHQGQGVCTALCQVGMEIADHLGLRMFESINKENIGSLKASQKACEVIVVKELDGGDMLIEDLPRRSKTLKT